MTTEILRYAAFTTDPAGGNPAGVVLDASGLADAEMQAIAAEVGFSETAFITGGHGTGRMRVRYFSPLAEVPFCGHATIATAVAWAERHASRSLTLDTNAGTVEVDVAQSPEGIAATLTSVEPHTEPIDEDALADTLSALRWSRDDLEPALPPRIAFAGARHLVLATRTHDRLRALAYDFDALAARMRTLDLTTLQLVHRERPRRFHARNPFPPGGVVEDPATGAAAAALGGYLRELGLVAPPAEVTIHQGSELGRPSLLRVTIPPAGGIRVAGTAVPMQDAASA